MRKFAPSLLFAVFVWSLLILRFGYRFGTGDQVELLPYALYLNDSSLYPHDFFIQGLNNAIPNERTVMTYLLLPFVNHLEIFCLLFQFLSTIALILGLEKLTRRFIENKYLAWTAILIALIPLNDFTLGNVELYSECFQASGLAAAIVVWAINLFLDRKFLFAALLLSAATFIQLLEGLDVMVVLSALLFIAVLCKDTSPKMFPSFISIYALTAGVYLLFIFKSKQTDAPITNEQLFQILFQFRHPHHFIFSSFPKGRMVVFFILTLISLFYFSKKSAEVFRFILLGLLGIIVYIIAVNLFHNILIANFQFYKITQWIKFLGVVAILGFVENYILSGINQFKSLKFENAALILGSVLAWVIVLNFAGYLPYNVPFQLFGMKENDDMISICEKIKQVTPENAVFIQPFENTELKFYAQRSSYIEFKANVRHKKFVQEWAKRIGEVYGLSPSENRQGFNAQNAADENFEHLSQHSLDLLKQEGVTHLLVKKKFVPSAGSLILSNHAYVVYQL